MKISDPITKLSTEQRNAIAKRLAEIEAANGGVLTADDVVADAKHKSSPLHSCFEWDVRKAAAAYWVRQARTIITSIRYEIRTETTVLHSPFYVRDPNAPLDKQGYVSVETLRTDGDMARDALINEFSRIADLLRRARELARVLNAEQRVNDMLQQVIAIRNDFRHGESPRQ